MILNIVDYTIDFVNRQRDTRYDKTNSKGMVLGVANVSEKDALGLKAQSVTPVSNYIVNTELLGVTLGATVIYVPTKQFGFIKKLCLSLVLNR